MCDAQEETYRQVVCRSAQTIGQALRNKKNKEINLVIDLFM